MAEDSSLREHLARLLDWSDAHASLELAVTGLPEALRGARPPGLPHSAWELLEHIRLAQRDILDFCLAASYEELEWPADYWPSTPAPPSPQAWDESIEAALSDLRQLQQLAMDDRVGLTAPVPNGTGQSFLREILLVADHTAYHVGQLVLVRRLLGAWPPPG